MGKPRGKGWQVLGVVLMCGLASGQYLPTPNATQIGPGRDHPSDDEPSLTRDMQAHQLKRLRAEHQKQVVLDTERLVKLAATLKADVENQASADAVKSADEIGKLAKRVSDRIKNQ